MEKFVINIGRQLGSGGRTVGEIIARRLGIRLYDKELINLAARESGICPEIFEKADEKESRGVLSTMIGYLRAPFAGDDAGMTNVLSNDALFKIQSDVIRKVAAGESAVFVGRCTSAEAQALMERVDARRASYYNYYSSRTWGVASTYHLCVSSSVLGDEGTADFILEFAARKLHEKM